MKSLNNEIRVSSLNNIEYQFPVGFAKLIIEVLNPTDNMDGKVINAIQKVIGCELKLIGAIY